jgi:TET-associated glycosyltransferase-like protein
MNPRYPVFVPTKGRWESRLTIKALERIGVPYTAFIEAQEYDNYAAVIDPKNLHVMPHRDKGLVVTRNYIWDYAEALGTSRFWTIDDNVIDFWRLNNNRKLRVHSGAIFTAMEDFVERYENVVIAGMNYFMFIAQKYKYNPIRPNTRVYSNMLIQTDAKDPNGKPYRNEGFYNDDTDLCLRVLKDGLCTILFNAFLIEKSVTMTVKGGMTPHYEGDGRYKMAKELQEKHPDVTKITRKWGRWQHSVDYRPFKMNKLIKRADAVIPEGVNNYGMVLTKRVQE